MLATKLQRAVSNERPRQQTRLTKDLKSVAEADDQTPGPSKLVHRLHDRTESSNGTCSQIITVAESARDNDGVGITQGGLLVPEQACPVPEHVAQNMDGVLVT